MKLSQLLYNLERTQPIVIDDYVLPIDRNNLFIGEVHDIKKDNPINKMHIESICADGSIICVLVNSKYGTHPEQNTHINFYLKRFNNVQ